MTYMNNTKFCNKCKLNQPVSSFQKHDRNGDRLQTLCKNCQKENSINYHHSKRGVIVVTYKCMIRRSTERCHPMPTFSREELSDWLLSQSLFHELYDKWVISGYDKMLKPSCDRTDDYKGYSLDRLNLMTWQENKDKYFSDQINGINTKKCTSVIQLTMEGAFIAEHYSIHNASRITNTNRSSISLCCTGTYKYAGGFKWRYATKY